MSTSRATKKVLGLVSCVALAGGVIAMSGSPALAADGDIGITILPGTLTGSIAPVAFTAVTYSENAQTADQSGTLTVNDDRGTDAGWITSLSSSALTGGGQTINATNVSVATIGTVTAESGTVTKGTAGALATPLTIMSAAVDNGMGTTTADLTLRLNVPAAQKPATYGGTLTVTVAPIA